MKILVGLGNPGKKYVKTRHNLGFWVMDQLAAHHQIDLKENDATCHYGVGRISGQELILAKPVTFMNESGKAVNRLINHLASGRVKGPEDVWVFHDDVELALGRLLLRQGGSAAGHKGLLSVENAIGAQFLRFRLGIGRPQNSYEVPDYVLEPFAASEENLALALVAWACQAAEQALALGWVKAQNKIHRQDYPAGFGPDAS